MSSRARTAKTHKQEKMQENMRAFCMASKDCSIISAINTFMIAYTRRLIQRIRIV